jgi:hypothetical protein
VSPTATQSAAEKHDTDSSSEFSAPEGVAPFMLRQFVPFQSSASATSSAAPLSRKPTATQSELEMHEMLLNPASLTLKAGVL